MSQEFTTTFWMDFSIADAFGIGAVKDTFKRAFEEWKDNYKYLTALVQTLNDKVWFHYKRNNEDYQEVYGELYYKAYDYAVEHLKGKEFDYFWNVID